MKIAIINRYQNIVSRGAETFVSELAKGLSEDNAVDIVAHINYLDLFKQKYDFVIPTNGRLQVVMVRLVTWLAGSKMIVSGQSGAGLDDRINLYAFPDAFVGLSSYQVNWAKKINPFVKVVKIPNGVSLKDFNESLGKHNGKVIISVGAFTAEKRHDLTIRAVSKIPGVRLIIVGSGGGLKNDLQSLGETLLPGRFEVLTTSHDKMPEIFKTSDLLAFPTVPWESFGIVLLEAMASGLAVVATDDPIRREIVGDAGILVDPTQIDKYAASLQKALNTKWGDRPRKQAEKFSWINIINQYEELFKTLLIKK